MPVYPIALAGESHRNEDGTSRQIELKRCNPGELVILERQPNNPHDQNAIFVRSIRSVGIGFIAREHNDWIAERIDKGYSVRACIKSLQTGGPKDVIGCVLALASDGEDPNELVKPPKANGWLSRLFRT